MKRVLKSLLTGLLIIGIPALGGALLVGHFGLESFIKMGIGLLILILFYELGEALDEKGN